MRSIVLRAVFAEPVVRVAQLDDAAAVGLDVLAAVVRPDFSGLDSLRGGEQAAAARHSDAIAMGAAARL